jgi:hypothetical protein
MNTPVRMSASPADIEFAQPDDEPDGPPAKLVFGLYRWPDDRDGAYYSLRYNNGSVMGNLATVRSEIWKIIDAEKPDGDRRRLYRT